MQIVIHRLQFDQLINDAAYQCIAKTSICFLVALFVLLKQQVTFISIYLSSYTQNLSLDSGTLAMNLFTESAVLYTGE